VCGGVVCDFVKLHTEVFWGFLRHKANGVWGVRDPPPPPPPSRRHPPLAQERDRGKVAGQSLDCCLQYTCLLQCVAVCCSVLQCVAVRCIVLQCVTVYVYNPWIVVCEIHVCRLFVIYICVLQCVAVCCSVLQCVAAFNMFVECLKYAYVCTLVGL